jgi:decaprenyl-phosphate phosphoribosyltransferase
MIGRYVALMRPGDWVKNLFVLPAAVFALPSLPREAMPGVLLATAAAVVAFSGLASGFYCLNDAFDVVEDRKHPRKRHRPVASGAVTVRAAITLGIGLVLGSLGLAFAVSVGLGLTLSLYAGLQALYNARLKRVCFVDVAVVATGFALRAAAGAVAIDVKISIWLVLCVFFLCLYLGFIKRLADLQSSRSAGDTAWRSPAGYDNPGELQWLLGVSGVLAAMTYLMYTMSDYARALFQARTLGLALLTPLVLIAIHRFYRRAMAGASDRPMTMLREDRAVLASTVLFAAGTLIVLYVPAAEKILEGLFFLTVPAASPGGAAS